MSFNGRIILSQDYFVKCVDCFDFNWIRIIFTVYRYPDMIFELKRFWDLDFWGYEKVEADWRRVKWKLINSGRLIWPTTDEAHRPHLNLNIRRSANKGKIPRKKREMLIIYIISKYRIYCVKKYTYAIAIYNLILMFFL